MPRFRRYTGITPPAAPPHLDADEAAVFNRVAAYLLHADALAGADTFAIEAFATALVRARKLDAALREHGVMADKGGPSALLAAVDKAHSNARSWARLLGIGPSSRRDMARGEDASTDTPLGRVLDQRPQARPTTTATAPARSPLDGLIKMPPRRPSS